MIRKLILPALAASLLAGCATGYQYRGGSGDYYYGSPGVEYRYYGGYGYGYPYGGYGYGGYGYGGYGYPYYYGGGYYYPWYRPGHGHGHGHGGGHDDDGHDGGGDATPDRPTPPWRDLGSIGDRGKQRDLGDKLPQRREAHAPVARPSSQPRISSPPRISAPQRPSVPRSSGTREGGSGSRMEGMLRRSQR